MTPSGSYPIQEMLAHLKREQFFLGHNVIPGLTTGSRERVGQTQDGAASHCFKDLSADNQAFGWANQNFEFTTLPKI